MIRSSVPQSVVMWPRKFDLFGIRVSATSCDEAEEAVIEAAKQHTPAVVSHHDVRALVDASRDRELREAANSFDIIAPDGQPVRWALNSCHRTGLTHPVTGTELMFRICKRAAREGLSIYLYGSTPRVSAALQTELARRCPDLNVAGADCPPFRPLSPDEDADAVRRINESGASIVFVGLGYPKQDHFAYEHRHSIQAVQICVGAAFDFLSGNKTRAPRWMQRWGLEWLFRLVQEPRRLGRRYLVNNTLFLWKVAAQLVRRAPWS
jgi:N-acetylglucosaminyldiphosphoundecaprenol N-acetyl-beta-D-mannosaminyltransferase